LFARTPPYKYNQQNANEPSDIEGSLWLSTVLVVLEPFDIKEDLLVRGRKLPKALEKHSKSTQGAEPKQAWKVLNNIFAVTNLKVTRNTSQRKKIKTHLRCKPDWLVICSDQHILDLDTASHHTRCVTRQTRASFGRAPAGCSEG
jgi:hypothetical protein